MHKVVPVWPAQKAQADILLVYPSFVPQSLDLAIPQLDERYVCD